MHLNHAMSAEDFRTLARRRLPNVLFDYIDGGAYAEVTLRRNLADLKAIALRQRVMRDMSTIDLSARLFGHELSMPVVLGPVGFAGMYARRGEVQAARAADAAGIPFTLSTVGICDVDEVAAGAGVPPWFQLYMTKDRGHMRALLARAAEAGAPVLVLTVDLQTPGARYRDARSGMARKLDWKGQIAQAVDGVSHHRWFRDVYLRGRPHGFGNLRDTLPTSSSFADAWEWIRRNFDPTVTWADLEFVRANWRGPIVVKGILDIEDAVAAAGAGVDGIVVSNHGGRQLDGVRSSIAVLPGIADAVGDRLTVLMDGGIRSGLDVLKALSLGADGVMLGRAWAFALAAGGEAGVTRMLALLREELRTAMVLTGCNRLAGDAGRHLIDGAHSKYAL